MRIHVQRDTDRQTYSVNNSGLCAISQRDHRLGGGVDLYEGHRAIRIVNCLHHGPGKSLGWGEGLGGGARAVLIKHVK